MRNLNYERVLVIGGAGFIGSHMVDHLVEEYNCEVTVVDNFSSGSEKFVGNAHKVLTEDISKKGDCNSIVKYVRENEIPYILNYAAHPFIPDSYKKPEKIFKTNTLGVVNLIESLRNTHIKCFLQMSTSELYGFPSNELLDENTPVYPVSTYASTKAAADFYCRNRFNEESFKAIVVRQFNCVGPRETHWYIVPEIIEQLSKGWEIKLGTNTKRDFVSVYDSVKYTAQVLCKGDHGQVYNIGTGIPTSMHEVAKILAQVKRDLTGECGNLKIMQDIERIRPRDVHHLQCNNNKLSTLLGKLEFRSIKDTLESAYQYYLDNGMEWDIKSKKIYK